MPLKRLPTELYAIIFEILCHADMDSDAHSYCTVLNLCLVSRYFRSIAVPIMYRTLLADGRTKVSLLSRTLLCRPELGQNVQYLFLSDHARRPRSPVDDDSLEVPPSFAFEFPGSREGRIEHRQRMAAWLTERAQTLTSFRCAVHDILGVVSPHLHALAICLYGHYDENSDSGLADALAHPFPSLAELTVRDNVQPQPLPKLKLATLKRLHLAGGNPPSPFITLNLVVNSCPNLEHIRISEPFMNDVAASALESLLSEVVHTDSGSDPERKTRKLSGKLQNLILKPSFPSSSPISREVYERLAALSMRANILEMVRSPPPSGRGNPKREIRYPLDEALCDWTDSIMGRQGGWRITYSATSSASDVHL